MRKINILFLFLVLCSLFFAILQWSPSFADPDSFYHAKATVLMGREGIIKSFPWLKFAPFTQNFTPLEVSGKSELILELKTKLLTGFTDQHFLYHLFLLPFTLIFPPLLGTKIAAILFAAMAVFFFYSFLKRWGIRWPWFYILMVLSIPPLIFRLNLAKAGPLSLIVLLIGLSLIWQKRYWALGILSFFYVWLHGGWILLIILTACHLAAELMIKRPLFKNGRNFQFLISNFKTIFKFLISNFQLPAAVTVGIIAGLVINPYFPRNLQFYWEQVIQIGFLNYQDAIGVGMEWYPYKMGDFVAGNAFGLILAIGALAAFFWRIQRILPLSGGVRGGLVNTDDPTQPPLIGEETLNMPPSPKGGKIRPQFQKILTLFLFSGILLVMTLKSQRFIEYFAPFFILANAFLLDFSLPDNFSPCPVRSLRLNWHSLSILSPTSNWAWESLKNFYKRNFINKIIIIYLLLVWLIFFAGKNWDLRQQLTRGFNWHYLQNASQWLSQNTPKRSLIFHSGWSDFPMLFYHNDHNVYLAGMDPTFFYRFNPELYKKWTKIIQAQEPQMAEIIKKEFGTNFILIKLTEKPLLEMAAKDPRFVLRYEDKEARVFEIR